jgi:hypothetical protein
MSVPGKGIINSIATNKELEVKFLIHRQMGYSHVARIGSFGTNTELLCGTKASDLIL